VSDPALVRSQIPCPPFAYSIYGLVLGSDQPIEILTPSLARQHLPDVELHYGSVPQTTPAGLPVLWYSSVDLEESGEPILRVWKHGAGPLFRMSYSDGAEFWLDVCARKIYAVGPPTLCRTAFELYLVGPVLGLFLRFAGATCLHASAVRIGEHAVAFVGPSGSGKSTTAALLGMTGHPTVSDDIVVISEKSGGFYVPASYPYVGLWPASVQLLFGSPDALPKIMPGWDKRCFLGPEAGHSNEDLPLGALYILARRGEESPSFFEPIEPRESLMTLIANTYATGVLDRALRSREFAAIGRLARFVPIRRAYVPRDPQQFRTFAEALQRDLFALASLEHPS
jgi:hypothetical protein